MSQIPFDALTDAEQQTLEERAHAEWLGIYSVDERRAFDWLQGELGECSEAVANVVRAAIAHETFGRSLETELELARAVNNLGDEYVAARRPDVGEF